MLVPKYTKLKPDKSSRLIENLSTLANVVEQATLGNVSSLCKNNGSAFNPAPC